MSGSTASVGNGRWALLLATGAFALVGLREAMTASGDALFWLLIAGVFLVAGLATREP